MAANRPLRKVNPSRRRRNPECNAYREAVEKYEAFHWGDSPRKIRYKEISPLPKTAFEIGKLHAVTYETRKGGERATWEHEFGEEGGRRPSLVADVQNNRLHIVGGDYEVRPEGIVD